MATARETADALSAELANARAADGGFGMLAGGVSEVEPTALAALALDDGSARGWLAATQRPDGGFAAQDGRPESPSVAALAALALEDPERKQRALAHAVDNRARAVGEHGARNGRYGWGWTNDSYSWVEPTSRVLLATKIVRPEDASTRAEAVQILHDRRCPGGGWNYGNTTIKGVDVDPRPYAQTTAVALMALQGEPASLVRPPLRFLQRRWRDEPGGLTLAQTAIALRLHEDESASDVLTTLAAVHRKTAFLGNVLVLAWAALASGPEQRLGKLRSAT